MKADGRDLACYEGDPIYSMADALTDRGLLTIVFDSPQHRQWAISELGRIVLAASENP